MWKPVSLALFMTTIILNNDIVHSEETDNRGCGWRNPTGLGLSLLDDNDEAKFGEFPWMAALLKFEKPLNIYIGGGSLIHPNVVLTAAHVVQNIDVSQLKVRVGEWDAQTTREIHPHQDRDVENIVVHEKYQKENYTHDIALLFLKKPIDSAPNVGFACLPKAQQRAQPGTKCLFTGWGKKQSKGHYSALLKKVEMPIISRDVCQEKFKKTRIGSFFELHDTFMCAGEKGKFTCKGDGGSPLVCPLATKNRYVHNGIAAWSIGCEGDPPSVFVDVSVLRDWIDEKVKGKGFEITPYSDY